MAFKFYSQLEMADCGAACLQMVLAHYGKHYALQEVRDKCNVSRSGITIKDISQGAKFLGLDSLAGKFDILQLAEMPLPCILHWNQDHFVVLYKISGTGDAAFYHIADPGYGKLKLGAKEFRAQWCRDEKEGIAILFEINDQFAQLVPEKKIQKQIKRSWQFIRHHLAMQKKRLGVIVSLLALSALISWVFPLLLTRLIDQGVRPKNINIVFAVLLTQFALFFGQLVIEWARSLISARFSTTLSISIITGFIKKLIRLPIKFFDTRLYTDILQKIDDHSHVEGFITNMLLQFVFSFASFVFLASLLAYYNLLIFGITIFLSIASVSWILLFLRKRRYLDYARFRIRSDNRNVLFETILGMPEVKINNAQNTRFETIQGYQKKLFGLNIKATNLFQLQQIGVQSLSQLKNILATFFCAYWVINDQMTLGVMVSIGYITGQLSNPIDSFVSFFRSAQDANIALNRLDEIQQKDDENDAAKINPPACVETGIYLSNVSFRYEQNLSYFVLKNIHIKIPAGKITAIVGTSGSGKTTLMKLLLGFYNPEEGQVMIDALQLAKINTDKWRDMCGVVLQEGYIFSGTIAENIAIADNNPDMDKLRNAAAVACILDYIEQLPLGFNTKIGKTGVDVSGGQKQRILIARAVYKNPDVILFDEATNALDATNEKMIMQNLAAFFKNKTAIIIAHRLSTVKNADQIIVLNNGVITETGNHEMLTGKKGEYYELVKNQLELGN